MSATFSIEEEAHTSKPIDKTHAKKFIFHKPRTVLEVQFLRDDCIFGRTFTLKGKKLPKISDFELLNLRIPILDRKISDFRQQKSQFSANKKIFFLF